ncbi:putative protein kinase C delta type homolog isoform X2 [Condylostylus longicornis]|uniref:putative protein kinase C delta type homolog isoform X2 n=1 Tax=Condylostylus longicornis TaxID=2530218 RepID=UPI00244DA612|nr:putative protein kinase C delta type homolog isoform X2 [Condylostylus longicornis]
MENGIINFKQFYTNNNEISKFKIILVKINFNRRIRSRNRFKNSENLIKYQNTKYISIFNSIKKMMFTGAHGRKWANSASSSGQSSSGSSQRSRPGRTYYYESRYPPLISSSNSRQNGYKGGGSGSSNLKNLTEHSVKRTGPRTIRSRRDAVKHQKIHEFNGHKFVAKFFRQPTFCAFCNLFLWGFGKQGYQCITCQTAAHKKCHDKLLGKCSGSSFNSASTIYLRERFKVDVPHRFKPYTFMGPTFCDHCGSMLYGFFKQGVKCEECDVSCHKKCEKLAANLCGVNQKLIVEALSSVRKGPHDARDSPSTPPSHNPAFKIDSNYDIDDETSYTYAQFQKTGRITAPATNIPRFKKYAVEDFHFLAVLGKGSFGKVLLAELRNSDYYYAVKCLKKDVVLEDDDVECTLIERKVLALGTKHPYLCHLFCTFQTESHLFFVMEYLNGGDLMFHIQQNGRFSEPRARFYAAEIVSGLKFLHKKGIVYRDLKLDNVLLDFEGHVRIADFGMCKLQIYLDKTADSFCGTPDYMAPEIIKGDNYNQNVDWWSFGVLLYEMLIGQSPFSGCDEEYLFWSICNEIPMYPMCLSQEATNLLKALLEKDSTKRIGSQYSPQGDILVHPFFAPIDWELLEKRQIEPPFKPQVKHPLDTKYFDKTFTRERVRLTPIDKEILHSMDQAQFQGFSYTNPNATLD